MHLLQQGDHSPEETWVSHRTWGGGEVEARQGAHTRAGADVRPGSAADSVWGLVSLETT